VDHEAAHDKQKAKGGGLAMMEKAIDTRDVAEPADGGAGGFEEEIHADTEEECIDDSWNDDVFPQFVLCNEMVRLYIRLEGYDNFFKQELDFLFICPTVKPT